MVATQCVAFGADWMAGATTWGQMMRRFRNQGGSKRGGENRHRAGGKNPRTEWFTSGQLSRIWMLDRPRNLVRPNVGNICVRQCAANYSRRYLTSTVPQGWLGNPRTGC